MKLKLLMIKIAVKEKGKLRCLFLEPLKLYGEGEYNLNVVKEIRVTDSFLGLDKNDRGCQIDQSFENCTTNALVENILEHCGCLPFNIRQSDKVKKDVSPKRDFS